ncbi:MAG: O-antigen ligase family protein [Candidatus Hydrogenedentes bacterium]|nr:O-antigen ligase family protein [Candidatus Hydrogenedentota bacterium]MBI3118755.1 O-antigen ligase family protein [Candidatus Hydrogenedentota bacterium]
MTLPAMMRRFSFSMPALPAALVLSLFVLSAQASPLALLALACAVLCAALLAASSRRLVPGLFVAFLVAGHLYRSPEVWGFAGVEWHPRELLLGLLLLWTCSQAAIQKISVPHDPLLFFYALYASAFCFLALIGVLRGQPPAEIVEELRYPLFLLAFPAFVVALRDRGDVWRLVTVLLGVAVLVALAGLAYFAWALWTDFTLSQQNFLGEFVRRRFGSIMVLSVRPSAHLWFEVGLPILFSLALCSVSRRQRCGVAGAFALAGLAALLAAAIAITMMRTAYVSAAVACAAVLFLRMRPRAQRLTVLVMACVFVAVVVHGAANSARLPSLQPQEWEVSLRARMVETLGAWELIKQHPVAGAGLGSFFEGVGYVAKTSQSTYGPTQYQSLHNVWLYILMKGGAVGLFLALAGMAGILWRSWRIAGTLRDPWDRALVHGLIAALAGQCVASITMARLTYPAGHVLVALSAAVVLFYAVEAQQAYRHSPSASTPEASP